MPTSMTRRQLIRGLAAMAPAAVVTSGPAGIGTSAALQTTEM